MKRKNNKQLTAMRAYRFTPTLAHIIYARARSLNINESEFVRRVLMDAVEKIASDLPSFGFLLDSHSPNAMPSKSRVGENTMAVM
jgi:hypothetical protein